MNPLGSLEAGLPQVGDEPLRGWRQWLVVDGDLRSLNGYAWPHREKFVATCLNEHDGPPHEAPDRDCTCGHYAAKSLAALADAGYGLNDKANVAFGSVKLWGRVVRHDRGFRTQYAYPELVIVRDPLIAKLIERNYGCEVMLADAATDRPAYAADGVENRQSVVEAAISYGLNAHISLTIEGRHWNYSGPLDPIALGRWFAGLIAQTAVDVQQQRMIGRQWYVQLMTCFTKP